MSKQTYRVIDTDTTNAVRWHSCRRNLVRWAAYMNQCEGRSRYAVDTTPPREDSAR